MKKFLTAEDINHELSLHLTDDLVAIFAVVIHEKSINLEFEYLPGSKIPMPKKDGQRVVEPIPTIIEIDNSSMTKEQRLRLAEGLIMLGQKVKEAAT